MVEHPQKHLPWQQINVLGEHAEDKAIDEVGNRLRVVTGGSQACCEVRETRSSALRESLSCESWAQLFRIR